MVRFGVWRCALIAYNSSGPNCSRSSTLFPSLFTLYYVLFTRETSQTQSRSISSAGSRLGAGANAGATSDTGPSPAPSSVSLPYAACFVAAPLLGRCIVLATRSSASGATAHTPRFARIVPSLSAWRVYAQPSRGEHASGLGGGALGGGRPATGIGVAGTQSAMRRHA